jgi:RNA polymerase II-associated protein 2
MATKVPAKSILKQKPAPSATKPTDEQKAKAEQDRKNLNLALQHAHRIQHQKDVTAQILESLQLLIGIPATSDFTATEAKQFTTHVSLFQPSDLDDLVEERRIDGRCGYVLCANPPRSVSIGPSAVWKIGNVAQHFCSSGCAKQSMYVKSQLLSVPAWERVPGQTPVIYLHEDDRLESEAPSPPPPPPPPHIFSQRSRDIGEQSELAAERGEKTGSLRPSQVMADVIVEKPTTSFKPLSSVDGALVSSTAIEGYEPKNKKMQKCGFEQDEGSDEDDDPDDD